MRVGLRVGVIAALLIAGSVDPRPARPQNPAGEQDMPPPAMGGRMVRGTVTAVGKDQLTIKTDTGETFAVAASANTRVRRGRDSSKFADIRPGDGIGAMGEIDPATHTMHALFVAVIDAEQVKKLREEMGKSYITGKVTAIEETKLTILRTDNVSQTIEVDEDTSFRKGGRMFGGAFGPGPAPGPDTTPPAADTHHGPRPATPDELLTLADLKVGDIVGGDGSLKHGVFVPRELRIFDPATQGRRRRTTGQSGAPGDRAGAPARAAEPK